MAAIERGEDRLEELQTLRPKGLITDEEYTRARSQILEDL
ncbi:SHOCT domain-containing protein [Marinobacter sp. LV10R520-4]